MKIVNRFLVWIIFLLAIFIMGDLDKNFSKIMFHKIATVIIAYMIAELIWQLGYKIIFGPLESMVFDENAKTKAIAIAIFRGILYAAIILGFSIGI